MWALPLITAMLTRLLSRKAAAWAAGVATAIQTVDEVWWLREAADSALRYISKGRISWPTDSTNPLDASAAAELFSRPDFGLNLKRWAVSAAAKAVAVRISSAAAGGDHELRAQLRREAARALIHSFIPADAHLPTWLQHQSAITGLSTSDIVEILHSVSDLKDATR